MSLSLCFPLDAVLGLYSIPVLCLGRIWNSILSYAVASESAIKPRIKNDNQLVD